MNNTTNNFAQLNNVGAQQLENGMYVDAIDSFTGSLMIVQNASAASAADDGVSTTSSSTEHTKQQSSSPVVTAPCCMVATMPQQEQDNQDTVEDACSTSVNHHGLVLKPLRLVEDYPGYGQYEPTVEVSVAIMFNLALAHHLNSIFGGGGESSSTSSDDSSSNVLRSSTLEQAIALYELAYAVQLQEDSEISVEFTMAIINNLGHAHKIKGDEEKSDQCFRHLLSTILFLQSYGQSNHHTSYDSYYNCTEQFVYSISHLILQKNAAPAA